jgi:hypothetical protein
MINDRPLPPFTVVRTEDKSHAAAKRLAVHVAVSPEDGDQLSRVTNAVIHAHARDNDIVWVFFHPSEEAGTHDDQIAMARALYVRNDLRHDFRPAPFSGKKATVEIETGDGVITVEQMEGV